MSKMIIWTIAALLFTLLHDNAGAQETSFTLDALTPTSQEISFTVPPSGSIPVRIMRKVAPGLNEKVDLTLSEFIGEQGVSANVKLTVDNTSLLPATAHEGVPFPGTFLPIHLQVPPLPAAGKYSGTLAMVVSGKGLGDIWRFKLTSAQEMRPATLVLDQGAVTLNALRAVCLGTSENPAVTVHVRDKTGIWMLDGVTGRLDPGLITPGHGFDMKRNLLVRFNDQPVDDIGASPPPGKRSVLPREQASMDLQFRDLDVGTYTIPLRFVAANSGPDDQQRLTVTIQVRHWWPWAVITLVIAALVSFAGTRVVTSMRRRAAFLERLREMCPAWLAQERPVVPVIWFRAKVRQVDDLSRRFWLTGQVGIDVRLTQAAAMLTTLDRIHQLRERLERHLIEEEVRNRAIWSLDRIISDIDADPSDQEIVQIKAELDALELWLDPAKTDACYWADLLPTIRSLLSEIQIDDMLPDGRNELKELKDDLNKGILSPTLPARNAMIGIEKNYQRLRILWDCHKDNELFSQLFKLLKDSTEPIFSIVDGANWERFKKLAGAGKLIVKGPSPDSLDPVQAYMPVTFRIETDDDPDLLKSYLLQKKLTYTWKFEIHAYRFRKLLKIGELEVTSAEPKVTQYAPKAGLIVLKEVSVKYASEHTPIPVKQAGETSQEPGRLWTVNIVKSRDFQIWRIAESADFIALFVAVIAGVVSGLMLYLQNPTFGAFKDYLQLFMWGAGIDQTKNFIQALGSWGDTKP